MKWIVRCQQTMYRMTERLQWFPPLLARITIGAVFIGSGWGKLHNLPHVIDFFRELGIPSPEIQAPFVAGVELIGGVLVLIGLFSRLAALPLIGTMVVALWTAKRDDIGSFGDLVGMSEYLYIVLLIWIAIAGPGRAAVDALVVKRLAKERPL